MPLIIKKLKSGKFSVVNKLTGQIHSKGTTKTKAQKQKRLINWIDATK